MTLDGPPLSCRQVAEALGVSTRVVRKLIDAGALEAIRLPNAGPGGRPELGRFRIPRAQVCRMLENREKRSGMLGPIGNSGNTVTQTLDVRAVEAVPSERWKRK